MPSLYPVIIIIDERKPDANALTAPTSVWKTHPIPWTIDEKMVVSSCVCEMRDVFKPWLFYRSETRVKPGIRSWKSTSDWAQCKKAIGGMYFTKKWRSEVPTWFKIWQSQTRIKSCIFKCISWLNGSFFWGGDGRAFLEKEVKTSDTMALMSPLNSPTIYLSSRL